MVELWGTINSVYQEIIGEPFLDHRREELIATFDTAEQAKVYIKKNTLKNPVHESFSATKYFRQNSLLWECESAEVREPREIPHNPE